MTEARCQCLTISDKDVSIAITALKMSHHLECFNLGSGTGLIGYRVLGTK